jgi:hypothetical protein
MVCLCFPGLGGCGIAVGHARTSHGLTIQPSGVVICSGAKAKRSFWARWRALPAGVSLPAAPRPQRLRRSVTRRPQTP